MKNRYKNFEEMKKISEFKEIPNSGGYVINTFGHVFDSRGKHLPLIKKYMKRDYVILIINLLPTKVYAEDLIMELFNYKYNPEDEEILKLTEVVRNV